MATCLDGSSTAADTLTAVLAEYEALRSEIAWLIEHGAKLQNYAIGLSIGAFPVAAFILEHSSAVFLIGLLLALPIALSLLGLLYFRQHQEVYVIAAYIREKIRPIIRELTGRDQAWTWEEFKAARQKLLSARSPILGVWRPRTILLLRLTIFTFPAFCSLLIAISLAMVEGVATIHAFYTTTGSIVLVMFAVFDVFVMFVLAIRFWKEGDLGSIVLDRVVPSEPPAATDVET